MKIEKKLEEFLRKERVLTKFKVSNQEDYVMDIHSAFIWEDSPEGHVFWSSLDDKFENDAK